MPKKLYLRIQYLQRKNRALTKRENDAKKISKCTVQKKLQIGLRKLLNETTYNSMLSQIRMQQKAP